MRQKNRQIEINTGSAYVRFLDMLDSDASGQVVQVEAPCAFCAKLCAKSCIYAILLLGVFPTLSVAQGSIFGNVSNADLSTPANGAVSFFGYINNSDAEIRTDISIGAGYDNGSWFDDFQNYLSESPGQPYSYFFWDSTATEGGHLSGVIPNNSFQQEDVSLSSVAWPSQPTGLSVKYDTTNASLRWDYDPTLTYHVYRRPSTSAGSFFRIDDPSGALSNSGIADSVFVDTAVNGTTEFNYIIIGENSSGVFSRRSELSVVAATSCCQLAGDANQDGRSNISDITFLIAFIFTGGSAPKCRDQADANGDNRVNITDVTSLVAWVFSGGPGPVCGSTGSIEYSATINTNGSFTGSS